MRKFWIGLSIFSLLVISAWALVWNANYEIPVLMYHHIDQACSHVSSICVSPQRFRQQMRFIKDRGYRVIDLDTYYQYISGKRRINKRNLVVITFDDGYRDNFYNALPVLKKYGFSACIFVVPAKLSQRDRLTPRQLKVLSQNNITIGSHTFTERYLPDVGNKELVFELCDSKRVLEEIVGGTVKYLCYPSGGFDRRVQTVARKCGYLLGFTTYRGYHKTYRNLSPWEIKRIKITQRDNPLILFFKLSGRYNLFRSVKDPS